MIDKLDFKPTIMNAMDCFIAEPYKVIMYDYRHVGNVAIEKPTWYAFYRIYDTYSKKMLFGNSVEKISQYESKFYDTKKQAFEACQKHFEKQPKKE